MLPADGVESRAEPGPRAGLSDRHPADPPQQVRAKIVVLLPVRHRWTATNAVVQNGLEPVELQARQIRVLVDHDASDQFPLMSLPHKGFCLVDPETLVTHNALEGRHEGTPSPGQLWAAGKGEIVGLPGVADNRCA